LIFTSGCDKNPYQASHDFDKVRASIGTGRSSVLSQHIIQSFAPNEVTSEKALQIGIELCKRFLKEEYQYYLAVHTDKEHIHLHCIFNNINSVDGKTFETHENQGKKSERSWKKFMDLSDELCRENKLSVIENPETSKGKSHYEWDMNRQDISWKAKLKFAIDQVVKESENFEDFLLRCKAHNIEAVYNPNHKIDLKFRLAGQQKFARAKTLGWYYEVRQIKRRIDMYKGVISYTPKTKIIATDTEKIQGSLGLYKWADLKNKQELSRAINIASQFQVKDNQNLEDILHQKYRNQGVISEKLNHIKVEIDDTFPPFSTLIEETEEAPVINGNSPNNDGNNPNVVVGIVTSKEATTEPVTEEAQNESSGSSAIPLVIGGAAIAGVGAAFLFFRKRK